MRLAVAALAGLTAYVLRRAERDYSARGSLSGATSLLGWAAYGLHWTTFAAALRGERVLRAPRRPALLAGGGLAVVGALLLAAGMRVFRSFGQLSGTSNEGLVTDGVFRYSRNPQNVGAGLLLAGAAMAARRPAALLLALGFWPAFLLYARTEEKHLARVYGDQYRSYRERTPRLIGRPGSGRA